MKVFYEDISTGHLSILLFVVIAPVVSIANIIFVTYNHVFVFQRGGICPLYELNPIHLHDHVGL